MLGYLLNVRIHSDYFLSAAHLPIFLNLILILSKIVTPLHLLLNMAPPVAHLVSNREFRAGQWCEVRFAREHTHKTF
jgi:hypothetical protein